LIAIANLLLLLHLVIVSVSDFLAWSRCRSNPGNPAGLSQKAPAACAGAVLATVRAVPGYSCLRVAGNPGVAPENLHLLVVTESVERPDHPASFAGNSAALNFCSQAFPGLKVPDDVSTLQDRATGNGNVAIQSRAAAE
jgi:hypothetical protein